MPTTVRRSRAVEGSPSCPTLRGISLVAFDLDGTLVDSKADLATAVNALLQACGATPLPVDRVGRMVGDGAATLVARAFAAVGVDPPTDALERFLAIYDGCLLEQTRPYEDVPTVLAELFERLPLAVLTNKPRGATIRILDGLALTRFFDPQRIVCGSDPYPRKPDPRGLLALAASVPAAASDVVLVGDSMNDWRTAHAAGARACLAAYGFGFESVSTDELESDVWVIDRPSCLLEGL